MFDAIRDGLRVWNGQVKSECFVLEKFHVNFLGYCPTNLFMLKSGSNLF
jgi:hypothetical protein